MDYFEEGKRTVALSRASESYRSSLEIEGQWADSKGTNPNAERAYLAASERRAEAYAALLRAALDMFDDGDLYDKWRTACQDAGMEVGS